MIATAELPTVSQLYDLVDAVRAYPVSAAQLVSLARRKGQTGEW